MDTYEKGSFYCVRRVGSSDPAKDIVDKYPVEHLFRVREEPWGETR